MYGQQRQADDRAASRPNIPVATATRATRRRTAATGMWRLLFDMYAGVGSNRNSRDLCGPWPWGQRCKGECERLTTSGNDQNSFNNKMNADPRARGC